MRYPIQCLGALSGGHQAQVALAKRPRLLILDEPVARLDPMARHEFLGMLMAAVAADGRPPSQFWPLQFAQLAVLAALSALFTGVTVTACSPGSPTESSHSMAVSL